MVSYISGCFHRGLNATNAAISGGVRRGLNAVNVVFSLMTPERVMKATMITFATFLGGVALYSPLNASFPSSGSINIISARGVCFSVYSLGVISSCVYLANKFFKIVPIEYNFRMKLHNWCEERRNTNEYPSRLIAAQEIIDCYIEDNHCLDLNNMNLTSLPESIGLLRNLKFVQLEHNELTSLPESIGFWSNLQAIWLQHNQLTSLPEAIQELPPDCKVFLGTSQFLPEVIVSRLTNFDIGPSIFGLPSIPLNTLDDCKNMKRE